MKASESGFIVVGILGFLFWIGIAWGVVTGISWTPVIIGGLLGVVWTTLEWYVDIPPQLD